MKLGKLVKKSDCGPVALVFSDWSRKFMFCCLREEKIREKEKPEQGKIFVWKKF